MSEQPDRSPPEHREPGSMMAREHYRSVPGWPWPRGSWAAAAARGPGVAPLCRMSKWIEGAGTTMSLAYRWWLPLLFPFTGGAWCP